MTTAQPGPSQDVDEAGRSPGQPVVPQYRHSDAITEKAGLPDRGHLLVNDSGWRAVADHYLA